MMIRRITREIKHHFNAPLIQCFKQVGRKIPPAAKFARGYTNKAIGVQLTISDRTVQGHLAHIFAKLQASSRTEAVMRAVSLGLISQSTGIIAEE